MERPVGRYPDTEGTIFHSDRGTQYASSGLSKHFDVIQDARQYVTRRMSLRATRVSRSSSAQLKKERIYRSDVS
ncbi:MAG: hypothetical protein MZU97_14945 [Bacillus subtilis]|nr:hypothetical protein [Bacillus subtilis]